MLAEQGMVRGKSEEFRIQEPESKCTLRPPSDFWILNSAFNTQHSTSGFRHRNPDVPVLHPSRMIALNIQNTWLALVAIDGAAGDSGDLLIINGCHSVSN